MKNVEIYTDGACSGNPGPGGYGCVLLYKDSKGNTYKKELNEGYKQTTNNRMELTAVIAGVEALKSACNINIYSDSKYVVDAFNKNWIDIWIKKDWKKVKNPDLWQRLLSQLQPHNYKFIWVKGHADNKYNEKCDFLAKTAANQEDKYLLDDLAFKQEKLI